MSMEIYNQESLRRACRSGSMIWMVEVYRVLGSSLGRTLTGNRDTTIRTLSMLMYTKTGWTSSSKRTGTDQ